MRFGAARSVPLGAGGVSVEGGTVVTGGNGAGGCSVDGGASVKPSFVDDENLPVFVRDPAMRARIKG